MNTMSILKDGLVVRTGFGRRLIANAVTKVVKKNTGITCNLAIDNLELTHEDNGEVTLKLSVATRLTEKDLEKILDLL